MLAACDSVYGLSGRQPADAPIGDGRGSGSDNDSGTDGALIDTAVGHDEDGDTLADGIDNCPGVANADQADFDSDSIGDVCDPVMNTLQPNHRVLFDPFTFLEPDWTANTSWNGDGETVGPIGQITSQAARLTNFTKPILGSAWSIDLGVDLPASPGIAKFIGVHPVDGAATSTWLCAVSFNGSNWSVTSGGTNVSTPTTAPLVIRTRGSGTSNDTNLCSTLFGTEATFQHSGIRSLEFT